MSPRQLLGCACGDGPLANQLACALERLVSTEEATDALQAALSEADLDAIPDDPEELVFFATGALHAALQASLGRERANLLMLSLAPVLDAAWTRDDDASPHDATGSVPPTSDVVRRQSGLRRSDAPRSYATPRPGVAVEEIAKADTIPAPSSRGAELAGRTVMAPLNPIEVSDGEPSSRRFTVPYLPKALVRKGRTPAAVVVDANPESRNELCEWLRSMGCLVAAAGDAIQARALLRRSRAGLLLADVESIAPDFEPIVPVLDDLVSGLEVPTIVLLSEEPRRAQCAAAAAIVRKPTSRADLVAAIDPLLEQARELA